MAEFNRTLRASAIVRAWRAGPNAFGPNLGRVAAKTCRHGSINDKFLPYRAEVRISPHCTLPSPFLTHIVRCCRVERIKNDGVEKAHWKEQENRQSEQLQILESISRRIRSLEASGRTTTPGENGSPDPPPESTD